MNRRQFLLGTSAALATLEAHAGQPKRERMGVVLYSYGIRARADKDLADPIRFLEFCRERGAGGIQMSLGNRSDDAVKDLRGRAERHGMYVEGSVRTPRDKNDVERFEGELRTARAAGAAVVRTVMLGGRRYETFKSAEEYRTFKENSRRSLELAAPVVARHKLRLAVENHKDYRAQELVDELRRLGSEAVGVCVDLGNNFALLEDPVETVQTLAPLAYSCHMKDMAVEESPDGFLLSEVPLGQGFLDLPRLVALLRKARPGIRFNLEMITRDPLRIPCLTDGYWATFADLPGRDLARTLTLVRRHASKQPLPRLTGLPAKEQLDREEQNVRRSFEYARKNLGL